MAGGGSPRADCAGLGDCEECADGLVGASCTDDATEVPARDSYVVGDEAVVSAVDVPDSLAGPRQRPIWRSA